VKYTHVLELKEGVTTPNQYRITVVEDTTAALLRYGISTEADGFKVLGYYDTQAELMAVLEPHLAMENSKSK
jgi:hypothetical protein